MQPGKIHSEHRSDILQGFSASSVAVYDTIIQKTIDQQLLARLGNRSVDPQEPIAWRVPFLYYKACLCASFSFFLKRCRVDAREHHLRGRLVGRGAGTASPQAENCYPGGD
jgi:hypothetical protein